ncbi:MAG: tail protein X [Actinomycetota bacterium]
MALTKAKLVFEDKSEVPFQFNPNELALAKTSSWKDVPATGRSVPTTTEYVSGGGYTLTVTMLLDTTDTGEAVTSQTEKLKELVEIDTTNSAYDSAKKMGRPPWVKLLWGDMVPFKCVCTSLNLTFNYFASTGEPLRATAKISLQQWADPDNPPNQNPTSGTPRPHRVHTVVLGESLDRIASKHYGNAAKWRQIADANPHVEDLFRLRPGTKLLIPDKKRAGGGRRARSRR